MEKPENCLELEIGSDLSFCSLSNAIEKIGFTDYYELVVNNMLDYILACKLSNDLMGYFDVRPVMNQPDETDKNKKYWWHVSASNGMTVFSEAP